MDGESCAMTPLTDQRADRFFASVYRFTCRLILYVSDVDELYRKALEVGLTPEAPPRDAEWGERYFHLTDPDGHELSFARRLMPR